MIPPEESLPACDPASDSIHYGLVMHLKLHFREGLPNLFHIIYIHVGIVFHGRLVELVLIFPVRLRIMERRVCPAEQIIKTRAVRAIQGNANAEGHVQA